MTLKWIPTDESDPVGISPAGWGRIVLRGLPLILILVIGVASTALIRLIEIPFYGLRRPITPYITQWVCRSAFLIMGIPRETFGQRMDHPGAVVSNHVSWLDIFALNAGNRVYFVSKSEVADWPGIGLLARITGTVFITRDPAQAKTQTQVFENRLLGGHKLLFFPEGTSTDGMRVLPFKTTLFQSFFSDKLTHEMYIQPVTILYRAPENRDERFYGWWGDMSFGPHLLKVLATAPQGRVTITYHAPVKVDEFANRKALAAHLEAVVRAGMPKARRIGG